MQIPMIALRGLSVFPHMLVHFDVGREKSVKALEAALREESKLFLVAQLDLRTDDPGLGELYQVGTISHIRQVLRLPGDNVRVLVEGRIRARLADIADNEAYPLAEVEPLRIPAQRGSAARIEAIMRQVKESFEEYASLMPRLSPEVLMNVHATEDPGYLADYITQNIPIRHQDKQMVLENPAALRRLEQVFTLLNAEHDILSLENELQSKLREQLSKNQREYYMREQIKTIQAELGEGESGPDEAEGYHCRIDELTLATEVSEKLHSEAKRLVRINPGSPEAAVVRTYLDTCLELPWNYQTRDRLDISAAARVLDNDHYGLQKVKERALEFLAVKRLAPELKGQILCLVGPPGVGKTSVAVSIARAMKRKHARLSLGGIRDEAEIRGHRKTYIGAMPGRIINAIRQAGSRNAMLLLDEIDKLGSDHRGDPSAALLEVLDPEQNVSFRDHYLEVPFDLSEVLFITTANTTDTIPRPLLDRMEVIELTSYTDEEKLEIARRHLIPKQLKRHGLQKSDISFTPGGIREIIAGYTRESGVRILEREIAAICRKIARRKAEDLDTPKCKLNGTTVGELLGVRRYKPERGRGVDEIGVVSGLAWTRVGGELLEVEAGICEGSGKIELTGNLGDVMKESAKAALTYIRSRTELLGIDNDFHKNKDIHIHFPEGAIPKDGPSAGITVATAMVSALTETPVRRDVAMTGEITLRGRVLPIGGLKEKTMAAFRAGIRTVVLPLENEKDLEDIDPTVRSALQFVLAEHMDKVLEVTLDWKKS